MNKVLVLGLTGMLGSMVVSYISSNKNIQVYASSREKEYKFHKYPIKRIYRFDASRNVSNRLKDIIDDCHPDYIINCIGIIKPYCRDDDMDGVFKAININARFPHILINIIKSINKNIRVIQIATDCVYDGAKGDYKESDSHTATDVYGKSKSLGEVVDDNILNIRCSIVGPELYNKLSLLEWFLSNKDDEVINGYDHHIWNGVTTLQFAKLCEYIISNNNFNTLRELNHTLHYVINQTVTKYHLLKIFNNVYNRKVNIKKVNNIGPKIDRTLSTIYYYQDVSPMENAVTELRQYCINNNLFN